MKHNSGESSRSALCAALAAGRLPTEARPWKRHSAYPPSLHIVWALEIRMTHFAANKSIHWMTRVGTKRTDIMSRHCLCSEGVQAKLSIEAQDGLNCMACQDFKQYKHRQRSGGSKRVSWSCALSTCFCSMLYGAFNRVHGTLKQPCC